MNKIFFKAMFVYIMFATGCSTVILSIILLMFNIQNINSYVLLQLFGVNIIIVAGIHFLHLIECRNIILEFVRDISYTIIILVIFGVIFNWFIAIPVWVLVAVAVMNYALAIFSSLIKLHKDTDEINELIKKRKERRKNITS